MVRSSCIIHKVYSILKHVSISGAVCARATNYAGARNHFMAGLLPNSLQGNGGLRI